MSAYKNVKDITIPSEESKMDLYPLDFEEFLAVCPNKQNLYEILGDVYKYNKPMGCVNSSLVNDYLLYMAIGGMPKVVETFINGGYFNEIDKIKREILKSFEDEFNHFDPSGRLNKMFNSIPTQLFPKQKRYVISKATGKKKTSKDVSLVWDLESSKTVLRCNNIFEPHLRLAGWEDYDNFKLYVCDTGLLVSMLINSKQEEYKKLHFKLLFNHLPANLGFLYENAVAQELLASGYKLYNHSWERENSTHYYQIDFLIRGGDKLIPFEVKSGNINKHASSDEFLKKYQGLSDHSYVVSQYDLIKNEQVTILPIYLLSYYLKDFYHKGRSPII